MEQWQTTCLGDACQFINGLWKGDVPPLVRVGVIRNTNFAKDGILDDSDIAYLDVEAKKYAKRRLQFGDLILEKSGGGPKQPVGRVILFDKTEGDYSFSNFTAAIRINDPLTLDHSYLHRYLHWLYLSGVTEGMQSHSTGIRNLNGDAYKEINVSYPPLLEQRRIVAILDEAFAAIATAKANTEKNLLNAVEVFNQQHDMVFADQAGSPERIHLGELATFRNGINFTKQSKGQAVQIIGVKDFQKHFWVPLDDLDAVTLNGDLSPIDAVSEGDILTVRSNGNPELIGRCMVVGSLTEPTTHSGFTIRISLDRTKAVPTYVCQFLRSRAVRRKLIDGGNGLNIKSLNQGMLAEIAVPLPPLDAQHKIVSKIEALATVTHELANIATCKLAALDELKRSLLHQAFTGKLTAKTTEKQMEAVA